jgi:hypothetical protein
MDLGNFAHDRVILKDLGAPPATPGADHETIYSDDGRWYTKSDAGLIVPMGMYQFEEADGYAVVGQTLELGKDQVYQISGTNPRLDASPAPWLRRQGGYVATGAAINETGVGAASVLGGLTAVNNAAGSYCAFSTTLTTVQNVGISAPTFNQANTSNRIRFYAKVNFSALFNPGTFAVPDSGKGWIGMFSTAPDPATSVVTGIHGFGVRPGLVGGADTELRWITCDGTNLNYDSLFTMGVDTSIDVEILIEYDPVAGEVYFNVNGIEHTEDTWIPAVNTNMGIFARCRPNTNSTVAAFWGISHIFYEAD